MQDYFGHRFYVSFQAGADVSDSFPPLVLTITRTSDAEDQVSSKVDYCAILRHGHGDFSECFRRYDEFQAGVFDENLVFFLISLESLDCSSERVNKAFCKALKVARPTAKHLKLFLKSAAAGDYGTLEAPAFVNRMVDGSDGLPLVMGLTVLQCDSEATTC